LASASSPHTKKAGILHDGAPFLEKPASRIVPEFRGPTCPPMPVSVALWFALAVAGSWQVAQLIVSSADSRGSK
jgi:hypothetical protein